MSKRKNPYATELANLRAKSLSSVRRTEIARVAAQTRWDLHAMKLGKAATQEDSMIQQPGQPILVTGDGQVIDREFKDETAAVQHARRLARKSDDDVYVYVASKRLSPSEPKVEEEALST